MKTLKSISMRLTKDEKEKLFSLLDYATDNFPEFGHEFMTNEEHNRAFYKMFLKLRLELRGY